MPSRRHVGTSVQKAKCENGGFHPRRREAWRKGGKEAIIPGETSDVAVTKKRITIFPDAKIRLGKETVSITPEYIPFLETPPQVEAVRIKRCATLNLRGKKRGAEVHAGLHVKRFILSPLCGNLEGR